MKGHKEIPAGVSTTGARAGRGEGMWAVGGVSDCFTG